MVNVLKNKVDLLTARDLAGRLAISTRTVWRLRAAGRLPAPVVFGGVVRWRVADIDGWLERGCPHQVESAAYAGKGTADA